MNENNPLSKQDLIDFNTLKAYIEYEYSNFNIRINSNQKDEYNWEIILIDKILINEEISIDSSYEDGIIIFYSGMHCHIEAIDESNEVYDYREIIEVLNNIIIENYCIYHYYFDKKCKKWAGTGIEKSINEIISMQNIFEWETPFREDNTFFKKFKSIKIKQWCKKELIYKRKTKLFMKKIKDYFEIANGI